MNSVEIELIKKFINPNKQERYLGFVSKEKTREKFTRELAHFKDLNTAKFEKLSHNEKQTIIQKTKSFKDCYIISENSKLDGKRMNIEEALDETIGYGMGTFIIFGNADIVYFEDEDTRLISINK